MGFIVGIFHNIFAPNFITEIVQPNPVSRFAPWVFYEKLVSSIEIVDNNNTYTVCSGLDNQCYDIRNSLPLRVSFLNEAINNSDTFDINTIILKDTTIDLITGREIIKKNQLFRKIPSQLDVSITEDTFCDHA